MSRALSESLGWLRRQALNYLVILSILLAGSWLLAEYARARALAAEHQAAATTARQHRDAAARAQARLALADQVLAAHLATVRQARDLAQQQLAAKEREREAHRAQHWPWAGLHGPEALLQSRLLDEEVNLLRRAVGAAQDRLDTAEAMRKSASALQRLEQQARSRRAEADRLRRQWHALSAANPIAQRLPWAAVGAELDRIKQQVERLQQEAVAAEQAIVAAARSRELAAWLQERTALAAAQAALQEAEARQAAVARALADNRYQRLQQALRGFVADKQRLFVLALGILVAALASRLLLKLLLYYAVAPWASRRRAVRLLGAFEGRAFVQPVSRGREGRLSAESLALRLAPHTELLVRPEYLQSSPEHAAKRTAWLLDPSLPLSSLLAGMYLLTRVRCDADDPIVLSPARDPFEEVCLVELPPGCALVCQPRSLAGVVRQRGEPTRVTRHWRIGSLHAWLTFQLRFLVFHGPCQLALKGRRGVRMEPAGGGRLIDQAATIGFDASVPCSSVRTETFVPYWLGKEGLFKDRFGGIDGSYLYEERPLDRRGNALVGRGLEGLADGVLKLFGI